MIQKRVAADDPMALTDFANMYRIGGYGLQQDVMRAVDLYERAAELGLKEAHLRLGYMYDEGEDIEKDTAKAILHWEAAAVKGDAHARCSLGILEANAGYYDLAMQHYMIAAKMGHQSALNNIKKHYKIAAKLGQVGSLKNILGLIGYATKADYEEALRGHQSAVEEMTSPDREEALALSKK